MGYTAKNRNENSETTVIEGDLLVRNGGRILKDGVPVALGSKMPAQANSTATDVATLVADHNALLAKLRAAGFME